MPYSFLGQKERLWSMAMTDWMKLPFVHPPAFQSSKTVLSERMIFSLNNFSVKQANSKDLLGGDPEENAQITRNILNGKTGPQRNVVLINAAAALVAAGAADDLKQGIRLAEISIDEGAAAEKMKALIQYTQENG